jgi:hypothetical protein
MTIKEQIIQELDSLPEPVLEIILANIRQIKSQIKADNHSVIPPFNGS